MTLKGWVRKRPGEAVRWLETEGLEGQAREAERPARRRRRKPSRATATAQESEHLIVALKPGNAGGAKGGRKVET